MKSARVQKLINSMHDLGQVIVTKALNSKKNVNNITSMYKVQTSMLVK
jgi:hypothetical protein